LAGVTAAFRGTGAFAAPALGVFLGACLRLAAGFVAAVVLALADGFFFAASFFILLLVRGMNFSTFFGGYPF
jgi:hypothetical protein